MSKTKKGGKPSYKPRGYYEGGCVDYLNQSGGVMFSNDPKLVTIVTRLGIRRLGMVDYLMNHCDYHVRFRIP